jgi:hypothetical protein
MGVAPIRHSVRKRLKTERLANKPSNAAGSPPPPVGPPPMQAGDFAAHERSQLATNNLDFPQGLPSKFDLRLEHADIPPCDGRDHKVIDAILQTTQGGFDPHHFLSPYATLLPKNYTI